MAPFDLPWLRGFFDWGWSELGLGLCWCEAKAWSGTKDGGSVAASARRVRKPGNEIWKIRRGRNKQARESSLTGYD